MFGRKVSLGAGFSILAPVTNWATLTAQDKAKSLMHEIQKYLDDGRRGEILRSGVRLAIFGPPNAGKSSLLNYLGK